MKKLQLLFFFFSILKISFPQNIGIGTISPNAKFDLNGDIALRSADITISITPTYALNVNTVKQGNYKLKAAAVPVGNFIIAGITSGVEGRIITLTNRTGSSMEIYNENATAASANRIQTGTGATITVYPNGNVTLQYDATDQRWSIKSLHNNSLNNLGGSGWAINGNAGTTGSNFIGTTDEQLLRFKVNNRPFGFFDIAANGGNIALGESSLANVTPSMQTFTGIWNTAVGNKALAGNTTGSTNAAYGNLAISSNTSGQANTGIGNSVLFTNSTGNRNTASGNNAMYHNTVGKENTAYGNFALYNNKFGDGNVAVGNNALYSSVFDNNIVAIGNNALFSYSGLGIGGDNTAIGNGVLFSAKGGSGLLDFGNIGVGNEALHDNLGGSYNTATGYISLRWNTTGSFNTGTGYNSVSQNKTGENNVATGAYALFHNNSGNNNTAIGYAAMESNYTGSWNTCIGDNANTSTSLYGAMALGTAAITNADNKIVIGASSVPSIVIGGYAGWSNLSDGRFKDNVQDNVPGLDFITQLHPVTYTVNIDKLQRHITAQMPDSVARRYYPDAAAIANAQSIVQTGFVAQEVEALVKKTGYQFNGVNAPKNSTDNYSIVYSQFVVPLVKAVQEQQVMIQKLQQQNDYLLKRIENLESK